MTEVLLVCSKDGCFKSVSATGHAGFASKGKDIVCAAESMLLRTAMEVLEQTENVALESDASERGKLFFSAECKDSSKDAAKERLVCVADFIRQGIQDLSREYPGHVLLRQMTE